jgi:selenide,water dikinase
MDRRLTEFSHGAGCGCKLPLSDLTEVLATLAPPTHPDLLVGADTGDDAAVWRLSDDRALVFTTDFFTPIVDNPRTWGRIAATNAVSDVYAMGGKPLLAVNLVAWNRDELGLEALAEVLGGAASIADECGFVIAGGHSIDDPEPKYGLAVIGEVHPDEILTNAGLCPGDALVLTKALGTGLISTAVKGGDAPPDALAAAIASMTLPNAEAARVAHEAGATAATDVTGYGLLGHLARMAEASGVDVAIDVEPALLLALADAQTSGGLLFGADRGSAAEGVEALREDGHDAAIGGHGVEHGPGRITLE